MTEMSPAEHIFFEALEIANHADLTRYLDQACAGDPSLRARVEKLLAAHPRVGSFLASKAGEPLTGQPGSANRPENHEPPLDPVGTVINDRYKLLQKIGEGGMGVVFMAEQQAPVHRKVALKIIKPGMDSKQVIARFEAERQALAMMDHVNIAKVYDAGTTESSRPFFVMELVHGIPILEYSDAKKLTPRERLELFVPVCQAIQHAHQKGIIHRDIKPSNVLVTMYDDKPVPKVIDFGVAKAIEQKLTEKTLFTQYGALVGTFEYMSPEQAEMNALGVDTRSDVYSLGVLLYELLTGTTPLERVRLREAAFGEIVRLIKEEEPQRPSVRLSTSGTIAKVAAARQMEPAKLSSAVRGELDWIAMRCLEKDRTRRYDTAASLAKDVQRYLADEPVEACPPSLSYRFRKFYRRNRMSFFVSGLIVGFLLLGVLITMWQAIRAHRAAQIARRAQAMALEKQKQAATNANRAKKSEKTADERLRDAIAAQKALQSEREKLIRLTYAQSIQLAQISWRENNPAAAQSLLHDTPKQLRGWEQHYLNRLSKRRHQVSLEGHTDSVLSAAFSPDGKKIVTASKDKTAKVWDSKSGKLMRTLKGHTKRVTSATFSPDGTQILTASHDKTAKLWDIKTGNVIKAFQDHTDTGGALSSIVLSASFSPDGKKIVTANSDKTANLWETKTGKVIRTFQGHSDQVNYASFSPDGKKIVTASKDQTAKVWNVKTGKVIRTFLGGPGGIRSATFSPDGKQIVSTSHGKMAKLWDATTGKVIQIFQSEIGPTSAAFSPNGKQIVTAYFDHTAKVWDINTGKVIQVLKGHTGLISTAQFSSNGKQIVTASHDNTAKVWDVNPSPTPLAFLNSKQFESLWKLSFSPDGSRIVTISHDEKQPTHTPVRVIDAKTGEVVVEIQGHTNLVKSAQFSPDGKQLLTASEDKTAKLWNAKTGDLIETFQERFGVWSATFSPDSNKILTASHKSVTLWDARSGEIIHRFTAHTSSVTSATFSPDGKQFLTASADRTAKVWNTKTAKLLVALEGHNKWVSSATFSPDGQMILTASRDRTARVWDTKTGKLTRTLGGHTGPVTSATFSPDGTRILTSTGDRTARLWDAKTGHQLLSLKPSQGKLGFGLFTVFNPDGRWIVAVSQNGVVVWDGTPP